jgi:hypothetical protein
MIEQLEPVRIEKLKSIEALGYNPTPPNIATRIRSRRSLPSLPESLQRILSTIRKRSRGRPNHCESPFGKAGFVGLSDGGQKLQRMPKKISSRNATFNFISCSTLRISSVWKDPFSGLAPAN